MIKISVYSILKKINEYVIKGHTNIVKSVKYGLHELKNIGGSNTILSGSIDKSISLWYIRSNKQTQIFNGHTNSIRKVKYSPFVVKNIEIVILQI
ncbi:hypothetical protein RFI_24193 [Reticulomyxa filosa]|uniref:Uncharacterized protein n=1 Tax=Reticulomyxa filosa TaxID=46433 RepID=X6MIB4_RETFI|nr:hypothetical protein RFI_24193 [Reticulomyxa filosa]|eukprot:ETO13182.1 hypothetical protein RFI_24193 [Reticulomyxa filosa]